MNDKSHQNNQKLKDNRLHVDHPVDASLDENNNSVSQKDEQVADSDDSYHQDDSDDQQGSSGSEDSDDNVGGQQYDTNGGDPEDLDEKRDDRDDDISEQQDGKYIADIGRTKANVSRKVGSEPRGKRKSESRKKRVVEQQTELFTPPEKIPLGSRNDEIIKGMALSIAGYVVFWSASSIYTTSLQQRHYSYFSNSAWAFALSFFGVILGLFLLIRLERPQPSGGTKDRKTTYEKDSFYEKDSVLLPVKDTKQRRKLDATGVILAVLVGLPIYGLYWWQGLKVWSTMFAANRPGMWIIFAALFCLMTFGVVYGLRPPTFHQQMHRTIPTRRLILLVLSPFALVFGMLYLAALYPPWP